MNKSPKYKLGDVVWSIGLTVRNSGTNRPNAYYLPVKVEIWRTEQELWWTDNVIHFKYGIRRPEKLEKRSKKYRHNRITHHTHTYDNMCNEDDISSDKSVILKMCNESNRSVRSYSRK